MHAKAMSICAALLLFSGPAAQAQQFAVQGGTLGSGSGRTTGSGVELSGTAGQPVTGIGGNASYAVRGGFWHRSRESVTGVQQIQSTLPQEFRVDQNYPNPFNPITTIQFAVPVATMVDLKVYDTLGREVTTLAGGLHQPGEYKVVFNGGNLASGVYFYRFQADKFTQTRKTMLVK